MNAHAAAQELLDRLPQVFPVCGSCWAALDADGRPRDRATALEQDGNHDALDDWDGFTRLWLEAAPAITLGIHCLEGYYCSGDHAYGSSRYCHGCGDGRYGDRVDLFLVVEDRYYPTA